jgi:hypothetical protein
MDTDRAQRESVNAPGWKWIPKQGCYLWWDGHQYTSRADWDGAQWRVGPLQVPRPRPGPGPLISGLIGLAIALLVDLTTLMAAANSPDDDPTWDNEASWQLFLAVAPVVGFVVGAVIGWARHRRPGGGITPV